jgi:uncharacterized protein (TIGR03067 family)
MKLRWLCIVAAGLLVAAEDQKDDAKKDLDKLQGTWKAESAEADGNALPDEVVKQMKLVVKGDKYTFTAGPMEEKGTLKLDPSKKPAEVDIMIEEGEDKGKTQLGLYQLDGDTFKICFGRAGEKERPKELAAKAGSGTGMFVLKREKQ